VREPLPNPTDQAAWETVLRANWRRIDGFIALLRFRYGGLSQEELADVKQAALVRVVAMAGSRPSPAHPWAYLRQVLRSTYIDFLRAAQRETRARGYEQVLQVDASGSQGFGLEMRDLVERYAEGRSALVREVLAGLLEGKTAAEAALELGTTAETVHVLRSRIRRDLKELGVMM